MFVQEATILHADVDAFYASVEQRDDPRLRGRPVIVGGGVVLAASYEAKAQGILTAMGGAQARRLCPQAIVVEPRMSAYSEASKALYRVFEQTTPLVEGLSIDEAFLDVRGLRRLAGTPVEIAVRLRREVRERVGLPVTVGVARTKFLAKVAPSSTRSRSNGCGASVRPRRQSSARRGSRRSARSPRCLRRRSSGSWAGQQAVTCTRSRTTATRARFRSAAGGARSARSVPSAAAGGRSRRSTRCSSGSSTVSHDGCVRPGGSAAP